MNILVNEIRRAAEAKNISLEPLSLTNTEIFWNALQKKYDLKMDGQLWCQINFSLNSFDPEGWRKAPDFIPDWPAVMFCDPYKNAPIYKFSNKDDVLALLEESFHFVFYLASFDLSKLVVFDDHECIRAIS